LIRSRNIGAFRLILHRELYIHGDRNVGTQVELTNVIAESLAMRRDRVGIERQVGDRVATIVIRGGLALKT
jgi:hypothetical protein